jgi:hypothetical protein
MNMSRLRHIVIWFAVGCAVVLVLLYVVRPLTFALAISAQNPTIKELSRITSPDNRVDAILTEELSGFSIEPPGYSVFITKSGSREYGKPVLTGIHFEGAKLSWPTARLLTITYSDACIGAFRNHWLSKDLDQFHYEVEIRLIPPSNESPLSCR